MLTREQFEDEIASCAGPPRAELMAQCYPRWFTEQAWKLLGLPDWAALGRERLGHLKVARQEDRLIIEIACWEAGMTNTDIAAGMGVTEMTVRRDESAHSTIVECAGEPEKRDKRGRPIPSKAQVAERRTRVEQLRDEGVSVAAIASALGTTERTVRADLDRLAGKPRVRKPKSDAPVERKTISYIDSPIVRSVQSSALRVIGEDWVKAIASLAESAETANDDAWFTEMEEAVNTLWMIYGRVQRLLRDKKYRQTVIASQDERDSSFKNTAERRAHVGVAAASS